MNLESMARGSGPASAIRRGVTDARQPMERTGAIRHMHSSWRSVMVTGEDVGFPALEDAWRPE